MEEDYITTEYKKGRSVIDIANELELTREAVYLHLRKNDNWEEMSERYNDRKKEKTARKYEEISEQIAFMINDGYSLKEIAKSLEISYGRIRYILRKTGMSFTEIRKNRDAEIGLDYLRGFTYNELAEKYDLSPSGIVLALHRNFEDSWENAKKVHKSMS